MRKVCLSDGEQLREVEGSQTQFSRPFSFGEME